MASYTGRYSLLELFYKISMASEELILVILNTRYLKPENILLDRDGHIKLSDFGLSLMNVSPNRLKWYIAPEVSSNQLL